MYFESVSEEENDFVYNSGTLRLMLSLCVGFNYYFLLTVPEIEVGREGKL